MMRRVLLWGAASALLAADSSVASSSPVSGAAYAVPSISKLTGTLQGTALTLQSHMLCHMRRDPETTQYVMRAICYTAYKPNPPLTVPIVQYQPAYHQIAGADFNAGTGSLTVHAEPCTAWLKAFAMKVDFVISEVSKTGGQATGSVLLTTDTQPPLDCQAGAGTTTTTGPLTLTPLPDSHDEDSDGCTDPWNKTGPNGSIDVPSDILGIAKQFGHPCPHPAHPATTAFGAHPTTLSDKIAAGASPNFAITVGTTAGYPSSGTLLIDQETLTYDQTSCGTIDTATQLCVTGRGTAAQHQAGATVYSLP